MPELIAKSALEGRTMTLGSVTLAEADVGPITSIAVLPCFLSASPISRMAGENSIFSFINKRSLPI